MAGTIRMQFQVDVSNGSFSDRFDFSSQDIVQSAVGGGNPGTVSIGTTEESISLSEMSAPSLVIMKNLDGTNFVEFGFSTTVYGIRLPAGEMCTFRLKSGATIYAKADTAACKVLIKAYEA